MAEVCVGGARSSVLCPPLWALSGPVDFYQGVQGALQFSSLEGVASSDVSGRLVVLAQSQESGLQQVQSLLGSIREMGFFPNLGKSDLVPSQEFSYLGMRFDTRSFRVAPIQRRVDKLQQLLAKLLSSVRASARQLSSLLGCMESLAPLVALGRLHKRPLQRLLRARWQQAYSQWDEEILLDSCFRDAVHQWLDLDWLSQGVPIVPPPPSVELFTDSSRQGWGAQLGSLSASGLWPGELEARHINWLELEAVFLALKHFIPLFRGSHVRVRTDNTSVDGYINRQGGTRSVSLSRRVEEILLWCQQEGILLSAGFVPGRLNVLADGLSRRGVLLHMEWTLALEALTPLWARWFEPMVDLFATRFSHRLPLYVAPTTNEGAWAIDALSIPWKGLLGYAFPPFPRLGKVVRKAREDSLG